VEAAVLIAEDVDHDVGVVSEETGFEDRRSAVVDQLSRARYALVDGVVWKIDEHAAGKAVARKRTDVGTLVEAVLEDYPRLELFGLRLVDFPPELLVALDSGGVPGFREAVRHGFNLEPG